MGAKQKAKGKLDPKEQWRDVVGYEGLYRVSDRGRVYSEKSKKFLRGSVHRTGYPRVGLTKNGGLRTFLTHVLVLSAFIGHSNRCECRHLNGRSTDNRLSNLKWGTRSENVQDSIRHGTYRAGKGGRKLTDKNVCEIRSLLAEDKLTQTTIGEIFGVASNTISNIKTGARWN